MDTRLRGLFGRVPAHPVAKAAVPLIVIATLATLLGLPKPAPVPTATPGPSGPVAIATPAAPPPTPEPWTALDLEPATLIASLAPERVDPAGVSTASRFAIRSLTGIPATELAAGVEAQPPIEFRVLAGADSSEAFLDPVAPLAEGQTYRIRLIAPDGSLGGSWAFRTQHPLQIVGTLPGDETTGVPIDTGIEVTFDQDGTTGLDEHFEIEPAVKGRFEQHGRTWSFIPDVPLQLRTAYRVTVTPGVAIEGSQQVLERERTFRFETDVAKPRGERWFEFEASLAAILPGEQAELPIGVFRNGDGSPRPDTVPVRIYRLPDLASTMAAAARLTGEDSWLRASSAALVPTAGLDRVASLDAPLLKDRDLSVLSIPLHLDAGAYLVLIPNDTSPAQLILQVSSLGAYALSTETQTLVWLNDLASAAPVADAVVRGPRGGRLGATAADGVATFQTPDSLLPPAAEGWEADPRLLSVTAPDGRWIVAALGSRVSWLDGRYDNRSSSASEAFHRWWLLLNTDRVDYHQTDTIHALGLVQARDDGSIPDGIELVLQPMSDEWEVPTGQAPVAKVDVHPERSGAFAADLRFAGLPRATYALQLWVAGVLAESRFVSVTEVRKPSYQLSVSSDRYAYLEGEGVGVTIRAAFFDGTVVPSLELRVEWDNGSRVVTTDANGTATVTVPAINDQGSQGWAWQSIQARPERPEEGDISGGADIAVFPSTAWLTNESRLQGTTLTIKGRVSSVDFAAIDAAHAAGSWEWPYDVAVGSPLAGRDVAVSVVQQREVRQRDGTSYDYLEKKVVVEYRWRTEETKLPTRHGTTAADGTYQIEMTVPSSTDNYEIDIRSDDAAGRRVSSNDYASATVRPSMAAQPSYLNSTTFCGFTPGMTVGLGATATATMHNGDGTIADEGAFLFMVANRGLRRLDVSSSPTYATTLRQADLPGFTIRAVQLTPQGYVTADVTVDVDLDDLEIDVRLTPDRDRYEPGDRVTLGVRTLGPDGQPIAADVVIQGVDEKLYAIGSAYEVEALRQLHAGTGDGFLQSFASHRVRARPEEGGCGDTGGEDRTEFGDVVISELVRTGADGRASVSFDLLDDLTSWRLTGVALTRGLRAGSSSTLIPVSLPFFVEGVLAPEYLVGEQPVLRVRGYGDALGAGDPVRFTVSAPSLGLLETAIDGRAFEASRLTLPPLTVGEHRIRIAGRGPTGELQDAIVRVIRVVPTRLAGIVTSYDLLDSSFEPAGGAGITTYAIVDSGRGALLAPLLELATARSARFDKLAAAEAARRILIEEFGYDPTSLPATGFEASRFEREGIALLPYASADAELTALAALTVPGDVSNDGTRRFLRGYLGDENTTSERRAMALAGLAGLGDDVLAELEEARAGDPGARESLWLALGFAAAGDENSARVIERALLEAHGERFGPWVRLAVGGSIDDTLDATRLLLVLSARLGEPFAPEVARYVQDHPTKEHALALEQLAFIEAALERLPKAAGRFAWTVDGERHEETVEAGGAFTLALTAAQRATLRLERLAGSLSVVSSWLGDAANLPSAGPVTITRTVTPLNDASDSRLVRVVIKVTFAGLATPRCWQLTDLAPSGLSPIRPQWDWSDDDLGSSVNRPFEMEGQRVSWCAAPNDQHREYGYVARVVTPGTFSWEPAVIQSVDAPELGDTTSELTFRIR